MKITDESQKVNKDGTVTTKVTTEHGSTRQQTTYRSTPTRTVVTGQSNKIKK